MSQPRKILPAIPERHDVQSQEQEQRNTGNQERERTRKRKAVQIACENCRAKKISCNGERPVCGPCFQRSVSCHYSADTSRKALKAQVSQLQQEVDVNKIFIDRLRTLPEEEVIEALRALGTNTPGSCAPAALSVADDGLTGLRPSDILASPGLLPPMQSGEESEWQMSHLVDYSVSDPLDPVSTGAEDWFTSVLPNHNVHSNHQASEHLLLSLPLQQETTTEPVSSMPNTFPGRELLAAQLEHLNMAYWSRTSINHQLTCSILAHFFAVHNPIFICFNAYQFLDDLVGKRLNYCSPFLVTSVLALACQSFTTFNVRSASLGVAFQQEATTLWMAERSNDNPLNLAAMCYLAMSEGMSGHEDLAFTLLQDVRAMATRMNLFRVGPTDELLGIFHQLPPDKFKAMTTVAWGGERLINLDH